MRRRSRPHSRAESQSHHRARRQGRVAVVHARLSLRHGARHRRDRRRRRWQSVPRLRGRDRGQFHRPFASRRRGGDRRPGAEISPHVRHGFLLRAAGASRRGVQRDRAVCGAEAIVLFQLRNGSDRSRDQTRKIFHQAIRHDRVSRQLPWPHAGLAGADVEQGDSTQGLRADAGRRVSRQLRQLLPLSGRAQARSVPGGVPRLSRASDPRSPHRARGCGRGGRRADPG